jgi:hypothetical protein
MPLAKFANNYSVTSAHGMTPFYANYGYHPSAGTVPIETNLLSVNLVPYEHKMLVVFDDCKNNLEKCSE